jgi:hypothetical protein
LKEVVTTGTVQGDVTGIEDATVLEKIRSVLNDAGQA